VNLLKNRMPRLVLLVVTAAVAALGATAAGPQAASADTGDRSTTTSCGGYTTWQSPSSGTSHARIRYCQIVWSKNIFEGVYWQTVTYQMRDELPDGYCAWVTVTAVSGHASECNAVWTSKRHVLNGRRSSITVTLPYGANGGAGYAQDAPAGS